jgi:hypothetical protein
MQEFYGVEFSVPTQTSKWVDHRSSASLLETAYSVFAGALHVLRQSLHPKPDEVACSGDKEPIQHNPEMNRPL